jgi:hypothetical protein
MESSEIFNEIIFVKKARGRDDCAGIFCVNMNWVEVLYDRP